ncbi:coiled-coil domain-containing protein 183-like isoform X1 [Dicentrarchus labrax]|uniref:coiled-coil domain-containing protein 183-like isoform X1 n=1 Tax=Dicentrarchus labrax TaxID=13489 RepID=UPI0021F638EC|nr:coiled-coil domain-containing protein 183-like isoform X1 [Dicentrarchus labrax]
MKIKIIEARKIQTVYQHIREHLQEEVCRMSKDLDQTELAVALGEAEVDQASKQVESAAAAAHSIMGTMVQTECETMGRKREMDSELWELSAEEKELKRKMETLWRRSLSVQSQQKERDIEEAQSTFVKDYQHHDICGASQSDMKLVEDMEALIEALGCADVQDLVNKVVSQRATKEQLLIEVTQYKELIRQEAETLADLEVQYTELKFSEKPATTRFDKLKEQLQAWLNQEVDRVQRLQAELKQSQDLLDSVEFGVNNFYFRMSCVALEELPSAFSTDSLDKLRDISARLPTLQQRALEKEPEISGLDQDKVYDLLEELNMMELKNNKRPTTPIALDLIGLDWARGVSMATDRAPSMIGKKAGVVTKFREAVVNQRKSWSTEILHSQLVKLLPMAVHCS